MKGFFMFVLFILFGIENNLLESLEQLLFEQITGIDFLSLSNIRILDNPILLKSEK